MNDRQINDLITEPSEADELDLVPEALKDLTAGAEQADAVRGGVTLREAHDGDNACWEAESM